MYLPPMINEPAGIWRKTSFEVLYSSVQPPAGTSSRYSIGYFTAVVPPERSIAIYLGFSFLTGLTVTTAFAPVSTFVAHALEYEIASAARAVRLSHGPMPARSTLNSGEVPVAAKAEIVNHEIHKIHEINFFMRHSSF